MESHNSYKSRLLRIGEFSHHRMEFSGYIFKKEIGNQKTKEKGEVEKEEKSNKKARKI
jgi:hypothetical protein